MNNDQSQSKGGMPTPPSAWACMPREKRPGHATPEDAAWANRRRFLDAAVRWPLLGAVALLAGRLLAKNASGPLHPQETCTNAGLCRGCRQLAGCRSLQADLFRRGAPPDGQAPERRLS
jgi:hypothetical protein